GKQQFATRGLQRLPEIAHVAEVGGIALQAHLDPAFRGARGERLQPLPGTVTRGVVAGHDLVGKARLGKQAVQLRVEEALAVVRAQRHRYAHAQPSPPRPHIEASTRNGRGVMPSTPVNSLLSTTRSASSRDTGPRVAGS